MSEIYDYIIIGGGSAGCACAARLWRETGARICVVEAGGSDRSLRVHIPFGLISLMHSSRDWRYRSAPMNGLDGRDIAVPRGRILGGSGSINSMVWFRGRKDDYDAWGLPHWTGDKLWPAFDQIEAIIQPQQLPDPHPLSQKFASLFERSTQAPTPERQSAGIYQVNMRGSARCSAAKAFLRPLVKEGKISLLLHSEADHISFSGAKAVGVRLRCGRGLKAAKGIILCAGAIETPMILMRSGIGPAKQLAAHHIEVKCDLANVGDNLHDHPAIAVHHEGPNSGPNSGRGLTWAQLPSWALAPFTYFLRGKGPFASNLVEAGAFFCTNHQDTKPDCQIHFMPFRLGWQGKMMGWGAGYYADVCLSRPYSRGRLSLGKDRFSPNIDLGLFADARDLAALTKGFIRLRQFMQMANFAPHSAPEAFPGEGLSNDDETMIAAHIKAHAGTSYHPVGSCAMGPQGPLTAGLAVIGTANLFVADASIMPRIVSANTNAPSMMIGWRAGEIIAQQKSGQQETGGIAA